MANRFVLWYEFRSLSSHVYKYMHAKTHVNNQTEASPGLHCTGFGLQRKDHHDDTNNVSYSSDGLEFDVKTSKWNEEG